MKIGFTGTQIGMTEQQKICVAQILKHFAKTVSEFHHGDCIGADAEATIIAKFYQYTIVNHPPINRSKQAFVVANEIRKPREYLERNHDIVNECDFIIATPKEREEQLRSGTWATIRYAKKKNKHMEIVLP